MKVKKILINTLMEDIQYLLVNLSHNLELSQENKIFHQNIYWL